MILWIVGLSVLSGILYRLGGKEGYNTKIRDLGVPCVATISLFILGIKVDWWAYVLNFGLLFGALTTYWGLDEKKFGYWAHGLGLSLATLPIAWFTGQWLGFGIRSVVLTGFITLWSEYTHWDDLEEFGRGASIIASLLLLLI